jgi:hydroxyacylglutathione hydrolase
MFIETIKSDGLAHLSYVLGSEGCAAVVDPRRDCDHYSRIAAAHGCRITHVFETHRNEDLLSGAAILASRTGADVIHGPNPAGPVQYAGTAVDGDAFSIGKLRIVTLETPGHTDDSLSYAVYDDDFPESAFAVFTGDTLFVGDVGRCDFYPSRAQEVAGLLFDSLRKLESLGDQAIIYPAHGAGSVCGSGMADRDISTIGHEKANNPRLRIRDRNEFIEAKIAEHHDYPPYFREMEQQNLAGAPAIERPLAPTPLTPALVDELSADAIVVDVRSPSAFLGAHLPDSLSLPIGTLSAFAGWFLVPDDDLVLVAENAAQAEEAALQLARIGFDRITGFLDPSLAAWAATGRAFRSLPVLAADEVRRRLDDPPADWVLLDVRGPEEVAADRIPGTEHVYLGELPTRLEQLDAGDHHTVMCASGTRATIAASLLLRAGFRAPDLFLGALGAWKQRGYETDA